MKCQIAPSILSFNHADVRSPVRELIAAGTDWIHFDVMDGQFVPPITVGDGVVRGLRDLGDTPFEAHLMTLTPERHFDAFADAGCCRIIFHLEATAHAHRLCQALRERGLQAGVAINPQTPASALEPLLDVVDLALVMTVNPGWGGQKLIGSALEKVRWLRSRAPGLEIEVDGGIDPATLPSAWEAGANVFVAGSFLAKAPTLAEGLRQLRDACG